MLDIFLIPILKIVVLLIVIIPVAIPFLILMERKVMAWIQSRLGPMRVGPQGILQAIVDPIKLILKEDITPARADTWVFTLAPIMSIVPALVAFAVIPFGEAQEPFNIAVRVDKLATLFYATVRSGRADCGQSGDPAEWPGPLGALRQRVSD